MESHPGQLRGRRHQGLRIPLGPGCDEEGRQLGTSNHLPAAEDHLPTRTEAARHPILTRRPHRTRP